jgi:hypothetical protein
MHGHSEEKRAVRPENSPDLVQRCAIVFDVRQRALDDGVLAGEPIIGLAELEESRLLRELVLQRSR